MTHRSFFLMHALPSGDQPPEWVHLMPTGTFSGIDGRGPFAAGDLADVIRNSMQPGRKLPIDVNHAIDLLGSKGQEAPAVGWIVEMQARADGIWGKVEWTTRGQQAVGGRDYGYLSPVLMATATRPHQVVRIARASLVNDPNLTLTSLHSRQTETGDHPMEKQLREALGLTETADQAAIVAAVTAAVTDKSTHAATFAASLARISEAVGLTADAGVDQIVTSLQARQTGPADDAEKAELRGTITSLQAQMTALTTNAAKERATTVIDRAIADGKVLPALRERYIARHMKEPADVDAELTLLPSLHGAGLGNYRPASPGGDPVLTAEDSRIIELMGVDAGQFAATAKTLRKETF